MRNALIILILMFLSAAGGWYISNLQQTADRSRWSASVLLEAVRDVDKMVLVEGDFNELFKYENFNYLNRWPFRKKTLLKLNGTVSVGFDLNEADIRLDRQDHRLILDMDTIPELIALSHEVSVVDIEEDWFNSFGEEDWTRVHRAARNHLERMAGQRCLYARAGQRLKEKFADLRALCDRAGWTFELHALPKGEPLAATIQ